MPNWIMGMLTVTGKYSDVRAFRLDALRKVEGGDFHIKGTSRGFVCGVGICGFLDNAINDYEANFCIQFAWNIRSEEIRKLSSQYPLTFEVTGTEPMINFSQHIIAKNGVLLLDEEVDLDTMEVQNFI